MYQRNRWSMTLSIIDLRWWLERRPFSQMKDEFMVCPRYFERTKTEWTNVEGKKRQGRKSKISLNKRFLSTKAVSKVLMTILKKKLSSIWMLIDFNFYSKHWYVASSFRSSVIRVHKGTLSNRYEYSKIHNRECICSDGSQLIACSVCPC